MDRDFRASFQKALLSQNELIEKNNVLMQEVRTKLAVWDEIIGKDENSGMRKMICKHEEDIRGKGKEPGLWTVVNRITCACGAIVTVGGSGLLILYKIHPDAITAFLSSF